MCGMLVPVKDPESLRRPAADGRTPAHWAALSGQAGCLCLVPQTESRRRQQSWNCFLLWRPTRSWHLHATVPRPLMMQRSKASRSAQPEGALLLRSAMSCRLLCCRPESSTAASAQDRPASSLRNVKNRWAIQRIDLTAFIGFLTEVRITTAHCPQAHISLRHCECKSSRLNVFCISVLECSCHCVTLLTC